MASSTGSGPLVALAVLALCNGWDDATFRLLLPEIRRDLGLDLGTVGLLTAAAALVAALLAPLLGFVADRVRRVRMLQLGALLGNAASIATGVAPAHAAGLGLTRVASELGTATAYPPQLPLLADWYPRQSRARVFAVIGMATSVGAVIGPLAGGGINVLGDWRLAMVVTGALATVVSLALFRLREPVRGAMDSGATVEAPPLGWAESWRAARRIRTLRRLWFAAPFFIAASTAATTLTTFYYAEAYGLGSFGRGGIEALLALAGVVGLAVGSPVLDRTVRTRPQSAVTGVAVLFVLCAVGIVGLVAAPVLWVAIVANVPMAFGLGLQLVVADTISSLVLPARLRAFGMQTMVLFGVPGLALVPIITGLADEKGLRTGLAFVVPVYLVGAAVIASAGKHLAADLRDAVAAAAVVAGDDAPLLVAKDVEVAFGGAMVLTGIDLAIDEGELVALVGTNGAGKSTLLRALASLAPATGGAVAFDGVDVTARPPHELAAAGVALVEGGRATIPSLTVAEHLELAGGSLAQLDRFPRLQERRDVEAGLLSGGEQQQLAIACALAAQPRLLLIDELSLGLAPAIVAELIDVLRAVRDGGTTVVVVEQSVDVALALADRAVFLDRGRVRFDGPVAELRERPELLRAVAMTSAATGSQRRRSVAAGGNTALTLDGIAVAYGGVRALDDVSFAVAAGETVGVIGPNGAGKTTLLDVVSGHQPPTAGRLRLGEQDVTAASPQERARRGLARSFQHARLFPTLSVRDALAATAELRAPRGLAVGALASALWLPTARRAEARLERSVDDLLDRFALGGLADRPVASLSTGQRHLVELCALLASEPAVLLLDEPSSGLSQAETEGLRPLLRTLARDRGCAVVLVEHDLGLIARACDRVVALDLGRLVVDGPPDTVLAHPEVVASFLGAAALVPSGGPS